jgi:hypothetical protein
MIYPAKYQHPPHPHSLDGTGSPVKGGARFNFTVRNIHNPFMSNPYGHVSFNATNVGSP